jgi:outer membrane protein assembly factor BamB
MGIFLILINVACAQDIFSHKDNNIVSFSLGNIWPMYCHDHHHTGRSPFNTNSNPAIKWSFNTNHHDGYGSTAIDSNGILYYNSANLFAIYPNGTLKWEYPTNGWGESTPAIGSDGTLYFGTSMGDPGYFYAVKPDGTTKWRYSMGWNDCQSSATIGSDETIYCGFGNALYALYPNGTLRWKYQTTNEVYSSPAIGDDGTVYFGSWNTYFYALYPNNGTLKWEFKTGYGIGVSPCIGDDGMIFFVSTDEYLYALYPNNGTMKWKTNVYAGTSPTIGPDDTIYAGWDYLHAVNSSDGSIKWEIPAGGYIEGGTPCTSKDGTIFYGTTSGDLVAVDPNGTVKWRVKIGRCESAPAIGEDGTIYIGSEDADDRGHLNAIGAGEPKKIEVLTPKQGRLTFFSLDLCNTLLNNTIVIGRTKVKIKVYQENELLNVTFKIGDTVYSVDTEPPFEWTMNQRFTEKASEKFTLTVIGYYRGSYSWTESIPLKYIRFFK